MKDGNRVRIETGEGMSCLTINAITSDDSGKYVVSVENIHGADCHFASVAVEGKNCYCLLFKTVTPLPHLNTARCKWAV